jgi:hypothetical protein
MECGKRATGEAVRDATQEQRLASPRPTDGDHSLIEVEHEMRIIV